MLGSQNSYTVATGFTSGWASLGFSATAFNVATTGVTWDATNLVGPDVVADATFFGLPTIGFAVQTFVNGTLSDSQGRFVQSSYGGNFGHRYTGPQ